MKVTQDGVYACLMILAVIILLVLFGSMGESLNRSDIEQRQARCKAIWPLVRSPHDSIEVLKHFPECASQ